MEFHGFCQVGAKHYVDITDYGKRQRIEVTAEEREAIGRRQSRAYHYGVQCGRRGHSHYSTPFRCSFMGEAWSRGVREGERRRQKDCRC
jgi:hypothetical protein